MTDLDNLLYRLVTTGMAALELGEAATGPVGRAPASGEPAPEADAPREAGGPGKPGKPPARGRQRTPRKKAA